MPRTNPPHPPEFRAEAVKLARSSEKRLSEIASDLVIATETLKNWLKQQDIDTGKRDGVTTDAEIRTRNVLKTVNGKSPLADAKSTGHREKNMRGSLRTGCSPCAGSNLLRGAGEDPARRRSQPSVAATIRGGWHALSISAPRRGCDCRDPAI